MTIINEMASPHGFEPRLTEPESVVLPLNDREIKHKLFNYQKSDWSDGSSINPSHLILLIRDLYIF